MKLMIGLQKLLLSMGSHHLMKKQLISLCVTQSRTTQTVNLFCKMIKEKLTIKQDKLLCSISVTQLYKYQLDSPLQKNFRAN